MGLSKNQRKRQQWQAKIDVRYDKEMRNQTVHKGQNRFLKKTGLAIEEFSPKAVHGYVGIQQRKLELRENGIWIERPGYPGELVKVSKSEIDRE
jgi:hypothetical protein